jgi:serine/threonine protein kinase
MDPSAYNLAPIDISRISYHSPEIAGTEPDIDFSQSDVYLLGLCMLEAASLVILDNRTGKEAIDLILKAVSERYSSELIHVLSHLLKDKAEERPSLQDIKEYIEVEIQIQSTKHWPAE